MKFTRIGEKIGYLGKKPKEKAAMISIGEAYSIWTTLVYRYDALMTTKILGSFVKDEDLKRVVQRGLTILESQREQLEELAKEFNIPMPARPPESANVAADISTLTDELIYREIYSGLGDMMFKHVSSFQRAHGSRIRKVFRNFIETEMELYDSFYEYGKLKAYLNETPSFRL